MVTDYESHLLVDIEHSLVYTTSNYLVSQMVFRHLYSAPRQWVTSYNGNYNHCGIVLSYII